MISLKKLLENKEEAANAAQAAENPAARHTEPEDARHAVAASPVLPVALEAYRSALEEFGNSSLDACPALGDALRKELQRIEERLTPEAGLEEISGAEKSVSQQLRSWGKRTARHYRDKASEIKDLLLVLTRATESVGDRDQRCAQQMNDVTERLRKVADLDDISEIRLAIESSAAELKTSIERMTSEGKAAIAQLRAEVSNYQAKLEEAESLASSDSLTGLRNRLYFESQLDKRMDTMLPFCIAIVDVNGFKQVNDVHGHLVGDELLKQFSAELKSACRSTDLIGRWGGDEFIILLDSALADAEAQIERLRKQVMKNYTVAGRSGSLTLPITASIGLAERSSREPLKDLIERADAAMYAEKARRKSAADTSKR
jgi:diguanylate cyclase (GGDEF)-like protein